MNTRSAFQPNGVKNFELASTSLFSDANLVSYYKFEGNSNDSKGSNNGTDNSIDYSVDYGKWNQGASWNANSDRISLGDPASLKFSGAHSIVAWINLQGTNRANLDQIAFKGNDGVDFGCISFQWTGTNTLQHRINANRTVNSPVTCTGTIPAVDSNWHLAVATYDGATMRVYWDGVQLNQQATTISIDTTGNWYIGNTNSSRSVNKYLDDIAFFSRALTADEIKYLYSLGSTKAYYPLNGNSYDYSGNENTGTDTAITYPQGRFGQAAKFNGSSSQILFTTVPQTGAGSFTASVWVKGSTLVNNMEILFWGNVATHQGFDVYMNTSGVMSANFYGGGGQANATTKLTTHSWQHVVATYDGNNTRIYINGRLEGVSSAYTSANIGTTNKFIGKDAGGGNWWNGLADEIILESRAWTAKEVETYYRKSVQNYRRRSLVKDLISFLISEVATLTETFTSTRSRNFSVSETATLTESITAARGKLFSVLETVSLSETLNSTRSLLASISESIGLTEVLAQVRKLWNNEQKNNATMSNQSKNTATMSNQTKNDSIWTNQSKN